MSLHEAPAGGSERTGLQVLRSRIRAACIPTPRPDNLRLATWNIRELGKGTRLDDSIQILASIIRAFDLVSVVELRDDMNDMQRVLRALGRGWQIVFSDYLKDAEGNRERVGFVFNGARVQFTGLASVGEGPRRRFGDVFIPTIPWWRPPFMASFAANRLEFVLLAAHVRWGGNAAARRAELANVAKWIQGRNTEAFFAGRSVFVVGDFNLQLGGGRPVAGDLVVPSAIGDGVTTDLAQSKRYDQILTLPKDADRFTGRAGALDFYAGDHRSLVRDKRMTKQAFTYQVSDHLPLWTELNSL